MNLLESYYKRLDQSNYDSRDRYAINDELKALIEELIANHDFETAKLAEIDRQTFLFSKSFVSEEDENGKIRIKGIGWMTSGVATNKETGEETNVIWPDISKYSDAEFKYLEKRYDETINLFAKTEYGQILYFEGKNKRFKHHEFQRNLCLELFKLSQHYLEDKSENKPDNFYELYFYQAILGSFVIAQRSSLEKELTKIIRYIFDTHQSWSLNANTSLRILLDITNLMIEYFSDFKDKVDIRQVLEKNLQGIQEQQKTYLWGAIYINEASQILDKKANLNYFNWIEARAVLYEKLADEAAETNNPAVITFVEKALRLYKELKNEEKIHLLEKRYSESRGSHQLSEIKQKLPDEYSRQITANIQKVIEENDEAGILFQFVLSPMYSSLETINENSKDLLKNSISYQLFPTSIIDKFGNTIEMFVTAEEKLKQAFWQSFNFSFQLGTQSLVYFFIESYKAQKLSYKGVISYLENTWYNEPISRNYNGVQVEVKPIDILKPGIDILFKRLDEWSNGNSDLTLMVIVTDSLVLKIEAVLRYLCEKIKIATFKPTRSKTTNKYKIVMEKTLDEVLASLKDIPERKTGFSEDDRIFIKYVLSEKSGMNLRNRVAHGLMDINEYGFDQPIILFAIIMRLSKYIFN